MTRHHDHPQDRRIAPSPERTPRLRLKSKAPQTGHVDGAWWPRTDALVSELPDLLAVLSVRLGSIDRVLYNVDQWSTSPARLVMGDRKVRLDGYRYQPPNSVGILGLNGGGITLLVVPPSTDSNDAHTMLMAAAVTGNASTVEDLLRIKLQDSRIRPQRPSGDQDRWESDGGSTRQPALTGRLGASVR